MCTTLDQIRASLKRCVTTLAPETLSRDQAVRVLDTFEQLARLAAAGRLIALARVEQTEAWKGRGHQTAAHWMAERTGTTIGHAIGAVQTAAALTALPETREAFAQGRLSVQQTQEIALAARSDPASEAALLKAAHDVTASELREKCAMVRSAAAGDDAYERVRRTRYFRHRSDPDGAIRLDARLAGADVAPMLMLVHADADRRAERSRRDGTREPYEAHMADALCALAKNAARAATAAAAAKPDGTPKARDRAVRATVNIHVDLTAWERGSSRPGERSEIAGVGPIPVAEARRIASEPGGIVRLLGHEGADITRVVNLGRLYPARLLSALEGRDERCTVAGCTRRRRLERDHIERIADDGVTSHGNVALLCNWHHYLKTHKGFRVEGNPGDRKLRPPEPRPP